MSLRQARQERPWQRPAWALDVGEGERWWLRRPSADCWTLQTRSGHRRSAPKTWAWRQ